MELRHIRYFLAVAEERNFTRAAARLGIGQPPLSQQIRDLEVELGVKLFHRVPTGAELTEGGKAFLAAVGDFPARVQAATTQAQRAARGETGALRVGFTGSAGLHPGVSASLRVYRRLYPEVALSLIETNSAHLAAAMAEGALDAAFLRPRQLKLEGLRVEPLTDEEMVAVLPAGHRVAGGDPMDLADLRDEAFILTPRSLGSTVYDAVIEACRAAGFEPQLGQPAPQMASVITLVAAELGVSIVPGSMRQLDIEGVTYRRLVTPPIAALSLAVAKTPSAVVSNFLKTARSQFG